MPKIQWTNLPSALRDHLFERLRDRKITAEDLYQLKLWRESEPDAPDGMWFKDFGSFKICGDGQYPKTFLLRGQSARGQKALNLRGNSCYTQRGEGHHRANIPIATTGPPAFLTPRLPQIAPAQN